MIGCCPAAQQADADYRPPVQISVRSMKDDPNALSCGAAPCVPQISVVVFLLVYVRAAANI
jgi:hypothetical protein